MRACLSSLSLASTRLPLRRRRVARRWRTPRRRHFAAILVVVGHSRHDGRRGELLAVEPAQLARLRVHQNAEVDPSVESTPKTSRIFAVAVLRGEMRADVSLGGRIVAGSGLCAWGGGSTKTCLEVEVNRGIEVGGVVGRHADRRGGGGLAEGTLGGLRRLEKRLFEGLGGVVGVGDVQVLCGERALRGTAIAAATEQIGVAREARVGRGVRLDRVEAASGETDGSSRTAKRLKTPRTVVASHVLEKLKGGVVLR